MRTATFLATALVMTMSSGLALAQPGPGPGFVDDRFAELDTNGDGTITRDEIEARIAGDFAAADTDGNGTLSQEEAMAFHQARREENRERRRAELDPRFVVRMLPDSARAAVHDLMAEIIAGLTLEERALIGADLIARFPEMHRGPGMHDRWQERRPPPSGERRP